MTVKWSAFPAGSAIGGSDIPVGLQSGANVQWTWSQVLTYIESQLPSGITVGTTTVNSGTSTRLLYDNAGFLGETAGITTNGTNLTLGSTSQLLWSTDLVLTRSAAATLQLGAADAASPIAQTLQAQSVVAGTSNTAGVNWTIIGSKGTGNAAGGNIIFQTVPFGGSGTSQNAAATIMTLLSSGAQNSGLGAVSFGSATNVQIQATDANTLTFGSNTGGLTSLRGGGSTEGIWAVNIGLASGSASTSPNTYIGSAAAATLRLGQADAASPVAQTLQVQNVVAGTSNTAGANWTITGSKGTGTGAPGAINISVGTAGNASATTQNAAATLLALQAQGNNGSDTTANILVTPTWNTSGAPTAIKLNVTNTASASGSLLMDLQVGGSSTLAVRKDGAIGTFGGNATFITMGSAQIITFTTLNIIRGAVIDSNLIGGTVSGFNAIGSGSGFSWSSSSGTQPDTILIRAAAATWQFGTTDAASPVAQTLQVQSVVAGTSNTAGANWTITGSKGTGTGAPGAVNISVGTAGNASATTQNAAATLLALQAQGNNGSDTTANILVTPTWNTSGAPTAIKLNVTNTASASGSLLMDLQVGSTSQFSVDKVGTINIPVGGSTFPGSGSGIASRNSGWLSIAVNSSDIVAFIQSGGVQHVRVPTGGAYTWDTTTNFVGPSLQTGITSPGSAKVQLGLADAASPVAQTLQVQSVVAGTSNTAGANWTITGSKGTGTGAPGAINFAVGSTGNSTATTVNAAATLVSLATSSNQGTDATTNISITPTWNTSGTPTAIDLNVTNTASAAASLLLSLRTGGTTEFSVDRRGFVNFGPSTQSIYSSNATAFVAGTQDVTGISTGYKGAQFLSYGANWYGFASSSSSSGDTFLSRAAAATLQLGQADAASPVAQTLQVQNVVAGTSNTSGANHTVIGSLSTGSGTSGDIIFQTGGTGAGATAQNAATTALTIKGATQAVVFAFSAKSTSPTGGVGYAAGAGSTTSQSTNKTTAWSTFNHTTGQITFAAGSLSAGATAASTMSNSAIAATDTVLFSHVSGGTIGAYVFNAAPGGGTMTINITNVSTGALNEQPVVNFTVVKGATS